MGLAADQVTGTEKQGLGYCLIEDGKIWPAKINDPGTITFTRNKLDATHSKTLVFKQEKFEELAEPLTQELTTFFDPTLDDSFDVMGDGATRKREVYLFIPRTILAQGDAVRENGFIFLPEGLIAADSITMPLDNFMAQAISINGGTANPTLKKEQEPTTLPATAITLTPTTAVGPIAAGTIVAKMTTDIPNTVDVSLFFDLAGTDSADFILDGFNLVAAVELTNTGAVSANGVFSIDISTSNLVGFDDSIASLTLAGDTVTFTVT